MSRIIVNYCAPVDCGNPSVITCSPGSIVSDTDAAAAHAAVLNYARHHPVSQEYIQHHPSTPRVCTNPSETRVRVCDFTINRCAIGTSFQETFDRLRNGGGTSSLPRELNFLRPPAVGNRPSPINPALFNYQHPHSVLASSAMPHRPLHRPHHHPSIPSRPSSARTIATNTPAPLPSPNTPIYVYNVSRNSIGNAACSLERIVSPNPTNDYAQICGPNFRPLMSYQVRPPAAREERTVLACEPSSR